jgi:cobalt-zinc-cadmium efflux system outer membrane protein
MNTRIVMAVLVVAAFASDGFGQVADTTTPLASRFVDRTNGLSLAQAIARARGQEPSLRAARSQIAVAEGMRAQASLRPNPVVAFERREEPAGSDNQTTIGVEWPLDLFRKPGRTAVAEREVAAAQFAVGNRERLLAAEARTRYGDLLAALRDLEVFDELVAATGRQHELLRSRVDEGASPPLERDLLDVELRRFQAGRQLQAGRTEAAAFELRRVLGMKSDAALTVRDTLEDLVERESSSPPPDVDPSMTAERRDDVREAAARIAVAQAKVSRAEGEGRLDVSIVGSYMRMDAGFPQRGFDPDGRLVPVRGLFHYVSAGARVTIPLLNRNQGGIAAARAEHGGATAAYDAARLDAETEVASARARDAHARQAVALFSTGGRTLARRNLTVVDQSYELGRLTVFDVLAQRRGYLEVERAYTDTLRAAFEARTALNLALGEMQ